MCFLSLHSSYPHMYMYTPVLESHTPQGATPPGRLVSLCDTPTMLPPQEMVPYNPEPFTGTGYRVHCAGFHFFVKVEEVFVNFES